MSRTTELSLFLSTMLNARRVLSGDIVGKIPSASFFSSLLSEICDPDGIIAFKRDHLRTRRRGGRSERDKHHLGQDFRVHGIARVMKNVAASARNRTSI